MNLLSRVARVERLLAERQDGNRSGADEREAIAERIAAKLDRIRVRQESEPNFQELSGAEAAGVIAKVRAHVAELRMRAA